MKLLKMLGNKIIWAFKKVEESIEMLIKKASLPREPFEILRGIIDNIDDMITPLGSGNRMFPFNSIKIEIFAQDAERRNLFQAALISNRMIEDSIRKHLAPPRCEVPRSLAINIELVDPPPPEWAKRGYEIEYRQIDEKYSPIQKPRARMIVLEGETQTAEFKITRARTYIGRMEDVSDNTGSRLRRNDFVFLDNSSPINKSVSRLQAYIKFDSKSGEYWLYDNDSAFGTKIIRNGRSIQVLRNPGAKLAAGDEIHFGNARVRFKIGS